MSARTRLLGIDYGSVRVGLAVSDAERRIASPLATYTRRGQEQDARYFRTLAQQEEVAEIVLGLPVHMSGQEGQKAQEARAEAQASWSPCGRRFLAAATEALDRAHLSEVVVRPSGLRSNDGKERIDVLGVELQRAGYELLHTARTEPWGQTVTRLLTDDGLIVGISYAPSFHGEEA